MAVKAAGLFRLLFALVVLIGAAGLIRYFSSPEESSPRAEPFRAERILMGTIWSLQLSAEGAPAEEIFEKVFAELSRIESVMSEWQPDSPISRVNEMAGKGPVSVPQELAEIISRGLHYGAITDGAFDITWRGLAGVWNLDEENFHPPDPSEVESALRHIGFRKVQVEGNSIAIPEGFSLGLGGIAKGYAIDRAATIFRAEGYDSFLINGGGDIFASGLRGDRPWKVGIREPRGEPEDLVARIAVSGRAVVTSGDYERFRMVDGVRYHHIIDPRTGYPAEGVRSVTVLSPSAEEADVLATAVFVLGPERGLQLAEGMEEVEVFLIDAGGGYRMTDGFEEHAEFNDRN